MAGFWPFVTKFRHGLLEKSLKMTEIRSLLFWNSLFFVQEFLVFLSVCPLSSRNFRGSAVFKNPCLFGGFPCPSPKKQGKEGQGFGPKRSKNDRKWRNSAPVGRLGFTWSGVSWVGRGGFCGWVVEPQEYKFSGKKKAHKHKLSWRLSRDRRQPCPSFPCFFGNPCFLCLRGIPCFSERFSFLFQGF